LLSAATLAFAQADTAPSMREIARAAGVGVGTLYRHFPTREALVDAVFRDQADRLTDGAAAFLRDLSPDEALRQWMDLFGSWLATKRGMLGTLLAGADRDGKHAASRHQVIAAINALLDAGRASGAVRDDIDSEDLVASLVGIFTVAGDPAQRAQAARLLDLLMDGLRASRNSSKPLR
jgi:AcrR family transcriptional regulator